MAEFIRDQKVTETKTYDPTKTYKWEPTDKFVLTGSEFGSIIQALRAYQQDPQFTRVLSTLKALEVTEKILTEAVEQGIAVETEPITKIDETMYS